MGKKEGEKKEKEEGKRKKNTIDDPHTCYLHMWWKLKEIDPLIKFHLAHSVDSKLLVRVHRHKEGPNIGLEEQTKALVRNSGVQTAKAKDHHMLRSPCVHSRLGI